MRKYLTELRIRIRRCSLWNVTSPSNTTKIKLISVFFFSLFNRSNFRVVYTCTKVKQSMCYSGSEQLMSLIVPETVMLLIVKLKKDYDGVILHKNRRRNRETNTIFLQRFRKRKKDIYFFKHFKFFTILYCRCKYFKLTRIITIIIVCKNIFIYCMLSFKYI